MNKVKLAKLIQLLVEDTKNINIMILGREVGFTKKEMETEVFSELAKLAQYTKNKIDGASIPSIDRSDTKATLATMLTTVSKKMLSHMEKKDFDIDDEFLRKLKGFMPLFQQYAQLEGLNKPIKHELELKNNIDESKLTAKEATEFLRLQDKAKIIGEEE